MSNSEVPISFSRREGNIINAQMACMRWTLRSRRPHARGDVLCTEPGRSHSCPDLGRGRFRKAKSRTLNMHAGEKSDSAIVPEKRLNNGRQLPAEDVEERAGTKGMSRQAAAVRTQSRGAASIRMAVVRRAKSGLDRISSDVRPEVGARCVSSARRDLRGGR